ncbi:MAG: SMR family transporter [bacterium]
MGVKYTFITLAILFNAFANIFMKYGVRKKPVDIKTGILPFINSYVSNPLLLSGIIFFGIALVFYNKALERFDLSIAYPVMTSGGIMIVTCWSVIFLGERISFLHILGITMITGGIWLLNIQ